MIVILWIALSIGVGMWAGGRGRGPVVWTLISLALSPLLGFILVALIGKDEKKAEAVAIEGGDVRKCPMCAELVKREAIKCKHCGAELPPLEEEPKPEVWG
jgi:hypothetical protein